MNLKKENNIAESPFDSPLDMFWHAVESYPDRRALVSESRELCYGGFAAAVISLAEQIRAYKKKRPTLAIVLPNGMAFCCAVFAGWQTNCVISVHNFVQPEKALENQFSLVNPDLVMAPLDQNDRLTRIAPNADHIFLNDGCFAHNGAQAQSRPDWPVAARDDLSLLLFTGGTTGIPKSVEHSFATIVASVRGMEHAWPTETGKEVWLSISPMFHVYGLLFCVLSPVFSVATNVMGYPFRTDLCVNLLKKHHVTVLSGGPPAIYSALLLNPDFDEAAFAGLKACGGGGAPFTKDVLDRWRAKTGVPITEAYGMTEMAPITANSLEHGNRSGSVGRAGPEQDIRIRDLDSGDILPAGGTGGIFVRGPQAMMRYHNNPEETAAVLKNGWLETGDVGHLDGDGFLFLTGRTKEMINVSGFKVYPRELDEIFNQHPSVSESCTLGIPDSRSGEAVVSCLVLYEGRTLTKEDIENYSNHLLSSYKRPKHIYFMDNIPTTSSGKQDRKALLKLLTQNNDA